MHKICKTYRRFFWWGAQVFCFVLFYVSKGSTTNELCNTLTKLFQMCLMNFGFFLTYKERKYITEVLI